MHGESFKLVEEQITMNMVRRVMDEQHGRFHQNLREGIVAGFVEAVKFAMSSFELYVKRLKCYVRSKLNYPPPRGHLTS
jgi:hypothetical protein